MISIVLKYYVITSVVRSYEQYIKQKYFSILLKRKFTQ